MKWPDFVEKKHPWLSLAILLGLIALGWIGAKELFFAHKSYWPSGQIKSKSYSYPAIGLSQTGKVVFGARKQWYENGQLALKQTFWENVLDGKSEYYSEEGELLDSWTYKEGEPVDGKRVAYWSGGRTKSETNYLKGELSGRNAAWAINGQVLYDWQYFKDRPVDGIEKRFNEDGTLSKVLQWKKGELDGPCTNFVAKEMVHYPQKNEPISMNGRLEEVYSKGEVLRREFFEGGEKRVFLVINERDSSGVIGPIKTFKWDLRGRQRFEFTQLDEGHWIKKIWTDDGKMILERGPGND